MVRIDWKDIEKKKEQTFLCHKLPVDLFSRQLFPVSDCAVSKFTQRHTAQISGLRTLHADN